MSVCARERDCGSRGLRCARRLAGPSCDVSQGRYFPGKWLVQPSATLGSPLHASVSFAAAAPASAAASEVKGELENLLILNECIYAAARHLGGWWWGEIPAAPAPPFAAMNISPFSCHTSLSASPHTSYLCREHLQRLSHSHHLYSHLAIILLLLWLDQLISGFPDSSWLIVFTAVLGAK